MAVYKTLNIGVHLLLNLIYFVLPDVALIDIIGQSLRLLRKVLWSYSDPLPTGTRILHHRPFYVS